MNDLEQSSHRRLRIIVVVQAIAGAITIVPLVLLAALAFGQRSLLKPENLVLALWSAAAVLAALFNVLGGVALYYNPRRQVILGSLATSGVLLVGFAGLLIFG